jgi:uncharacterized protein
MRNRTKKSQAELPVTSPIAFYPCSNGEYCPRPPTRLDRKAEEMFHRIVEDKHRRLGMTRRQFAESACGMAAALFVIDKIYGCGSNGMGTGPGPNGGSAGTTGRMTVQMPGDPTMPGTSGSNVTGSPNQAPTATPATGGSPSSPSAASQGGQGGFSGITEPMMEDEEVACEALLNSEQFILDIQTHPQNPITQPWTGRNLPMNATSYINTMFASSETSVAVLSGIPTVRNLGLPNIEANALLEDIFNEIAGPRLIFHANVRPQNGASEMDYMEMISASHKPSAWKCYPHEGPWRLDSQEVGLPFVEKAIELGLPLIAAHRGLNSDSGDNSAPSSPIDLVQAAAQYKEVNFITYHSGWQQNVDEDHPFDPAESNPRGVDRLVKACVDNNIGNEGNVYAELGSTWQGVMNNPGAAAHLLGKLLRYVGPDRVVWGTDCVFYGSPQAQISAFRAFEIPQNMQDEFGYPALTPQLKQKIFGLNAAGIYKVDPNKRRCEVQSDWVNDVREAYLQDRDSVPMPRDMYYGPRSRREFLAFKRFEDYFKLS